MFKILQRSFGIKILSNLNTVKILQKKISFFSRKFVGQKSAARIDAVNIFYYKCSFFLFFSEKNIWTEKFSEFIFYFYLVYFIHFLYRFFWIFQIFSELLIFHFFPTFLKLFKDFFTFSNFLVQKKIFRKKN